MPKPLDALQPSHFRTFGALLKYLRRRARYTQGELADLVGYSREQITKLETDRRLPDPMTVRARFLTALDLERDSAFAERLIELAELARSDDHYTYGDDSAETPLTLPRPLTTWVGSLGVIADIVTLLRQQRMVVLVGAGGVGKSRLALEVALAHGQHFADGAVMVQLASVSAPERLPEVLLAALGLGGAHRPPLEVLYDHLAASERLLLLDNCEHLASACNQLTAALLERCPRLAILATSRQTFSGFHAALWRVPSLGLPADDASFAAIRASDAVRLFVERARAVRADFAITPANASAIAAIVRRLDGIPLAIELAAARMRALAPDQLLARLDDRFRLLASDQQGLRRHQTLRAAVDWSYDTLDDPEKALLRRLAIFRSGWTLDAAEALWPDDALLVVDGLTRLVDKSLVQVEETEVGTRYFMLETIQAYASNKLHDSGDYQACACQHLRVCVDLSARLAAGFQCRAEPVDQHYWVQYAEAERDNLRAALTFALASGHREEGLALISNLWLLWYWRSSAHEGAQIAAHFMRMGRLEDLPGPLRARACVAAAGLAARDASTAEAYDDWWLWMTEAEAAARAVGDDESLAWSLVQQSALVPTYEDARDCLQEAEAAAFRAGSDWLRAVCLFVLGDRARAEDDDQRAAEAYMESAGLCRTLGDRTVLPYVVGNLGRLAFQRGAFAPARIAFQESVALAGEMRNLLGVADWTLYLAATAQQLGDAGGFRAALRECLPPLRDFGRYEGVASALVMAAHHALAAGQPGLAARWAGAVETLLARQHIALPLDEPGGQTDYTRLQSYLHAALSPETAAAWWNGGRALGLPAVVEDVLQKLGDL
jgi:predicted ATPase/transcriptional regulator with XRE-family HTH domain